MPQVFSFNAWLPLPSDLDQIIAPPYDVVSRDEVRVYTENNPLHFLNVTRPEGRMPSSVPFDDPAVYRAAGQHWHEFIKQGVFKADKQSRFYIYGMDDQIGLVALVSVMDYKSGVIRKHELTRPDKENDRVRHIQAVSGQLSPVLLAVKDTGSIDALLRRCASGAPYLSARLNGVVHSLWPVKTADDQAMIQSLFEAQDLLYVADGHHRSAAALRAYEESPRDSLAAQHPYCLAVIFPHQHMHILGYHRTVRDLQGHSPESFLQALNTHYQVEPLTELSLPTEHGVCHMLLGTQAYALRRRDLEADDPVRSLDVSALSRHVLTPLLGIEDIRTDPRIGFVGGDKALRVIQQQMKQGEIAVGFLMYPTQIDELLAVADANHLMPPKSTWFEPKLADGLFCYAY